MRNFSSLAAGSTYMINVTVAYPVLLQGQDLPEHYMSRSARHQMLGYSGLERQCREVVKRTPLCDYTGEGRNGRVVQPGRNRMNRARREGWDTLRKGFNYSRQGGVRCQVSHLFFFLFKSCVEYFSVSNLKSVDQVTTLCKIYIQNTDGHRNYY